MAKEGKSFNDILEYYYTGIKIDKYPLPCIKYPLYGKIIVIDPGHGGKISAMWETWDLKKKI